MMDKIARDYVFLSDMFKDSSPEKIEKLKAGVKDMMETEAYMYLKYIGLKNIMFAIDSNMDVEADTAEKMIYMAEHISQPPRPPVEPRKSHFRG